MFRCLRSLLVALVLSPTVLILASPTDAHDTWISRGNHRNAAGEWCCGDGDCALMDKEAVGFTPTGYRLRGFGTISTGQSSVREGYDEVIPATEAQPSPDGAYWRCKRPDGTRRCFFAPPPSY